MLRNGFKNASNIEAIYVYIIFYSYQPSLICLYIFEVAWSLLHIKFPLIPTFFRTVFRRLCLTCIQMRHRHAYKSVFSPSLSLLLSCPYVKLANRSQLFIFPFGLCSPSSLYKPWWPHTFPQPPPHLAGQPAIAVWLFLLLTWFLWLTQLPLGCDARDSEDSCGRMRVQRRLYVNNGHLLARVPLSTTNTAHGVGLGHKTLDSFLFLNSFGLWISLVQGAASVIEKQKKM